MAKKTWLAGVVYVELLLILTTNLLSVEPTFIKLLPGSSALTSGSSLQALSARLGIRQISLLYGRVLLTMQPMLCCF